MNTDLQIHLEKILDDKISYINSVSGGCIADSKKIKLNSGKVYFLKNIHNANSQIFESEALGLAELLKAEAIRIPQVLAKGSDFLLLEWIDKSNKITESTMELFGYQFAKLHQFHGKKFGFRLDNFLGDTPQLNIPTNEGSKNWVTFFIENRLMYQLELAKKNGHATQELLKSLENLIEKIPNILSGTEEAPTLLHGDLWSGNYLIDESGNPCLIDPAVYYGHREADLAMTSLFGGFTDAFYSAYETELPLLPEYSEREPIYQLYHLMNHLNLFGGGYYGQVIKILKYYE